VISNLRSEYGATVWIEMNPITNLVVESSHTDEIQIGSVTSAIRKR